MNFLKRKWSQRQLVLAWIVLAAVVVFGTMFICSCSFVNVVDNGTGKMYFTWEKDPTKFLKDQNIAINEGDVLKSPDGLYAFSKIEIVRGFDVTIRDGSQTLKVKSVKSSVADILKKNNISYDDDDILSNKLDEVISEPTLISVDHIEKKVEQSVVPIPAQIQYVRSPDVFIGRYLEVRAGTNGKKNVESQVVYKNNQEVSRTVLNEEIVTQPIDRVVKVGTKGTTLTSRGESLRFSKVIDVSAYAYSTGWRTAIGTTPRVGTIAVDPSVIPLGSRLYVESADGSSWAYGYAVAEDTGSGIKGDKIDLYMQSSDLCKQFGIRSARVYILE